MFGANNFATVLEEAPGLAAVAVANRPCWYFSIPPLNCPCLPAPRRQGAVNSQRLFSIKFEGRIIAFAHGKGLRGHPARELKSSSADPPRILRCGERFRFRLECV